MTSLAKASQRARRLYPRAKNFQGAYMKGYRAAAAGRAESACPYKRDPSKTWGGVYRRAWLQGFQSVPRRVG